MVHLRPKRSAAADDGITDAKLTTPISVNTKPAAATLSSVMSASHIESTAHA